jgi:hypothetical protein
VIVANCCFHHIADDKLSTELARMRSLLTDGGTFVMIDIVFPAENDPSFPSPAVQKAGAGNLRAPPRSVPGHCRATFRVRRRRPR